MTGSTLVTPHRVSPLELSVPPENVFGHVKKVHLLRQALSTLRVEHRSGLRVLDVGCGNGSAVTRFLTHADDEVLGIDIHEPSISYARAHFERPGLRFEPRTLESLLNRGLRFDAIVFGDVLEHVPHPGAWLTAARELLAGGGRVLVTVPNGHGPFEIESSLSRLPFVGKTLIRILDLAVAVLNKWILPGRWSAVVTPPDVPYNSESGHVQFFTLPVLLALARRSGLRPIARRNLSCVSGPFSNYILAPFTSLCRLNTAIADLLPAACASAWFLEFAPSERSQQSHGD